MTGSLLEVLSAVADKPVLLAIALFGATFVAEDVATIAAGLLVARLGASPTAALAGVILGTALGDAALYVAGRWGAHTRIGKRLRMRRDVMRAEHWVRDHALWLVFAARFLPGTRLPVFTASGFARARAAAVFAIIAVSTPVWTAGIFEAARRAGTAGADQVMATFLPLALLLLGIGTLVRRRALST